ncbi:MAG: energy transducer TonB [Gemmatimonadota bacterium]
MNIVLALGLASTLLAPFPVDTPPPPPIQALERMNTLADVLANTRLEDGRHAPARLQPPGMLNQETMVAFLVANYPDTLRATGAPDVGFVWMFVDSTGRLGGMKLIKSTGAAVFDTLSLRAIRTVRFFPANMDGRGVGVWVPFPLQIGAYDKLLAWRPPGEELDRGPVFTPYTKKPELLNRDVVARELVRRYPPELRAAGVAGTAVVWVLLQDNGMVKRVLIRNSSGHPQIDEAALHVARVMRFTPAQNKGKPVPVWIALPIVFKPR